MPYDVEGIDIGFIAYRKATIDEARELEVLLIEKFLRIINSHEKIRPYLREYLFPSGRAHISISFRQKNNEREVKDSISYVLQARNRLFYNTFDPKIENLIEVTNESYEDAFKIVHSKLSN